MNPQKMILCGVVLSGICSGSLFAKPMMNAAVLVSSQASPDVACMVQAIARDQGLLSQNTKFTLIDYDGSIIGARTAAQKTSKQGFDVVIGPLLSPESQATIPLFAEQNIPQILPMATEPELTQNAKSVVRMLSRADHYANLAAQYAIANISPKRILVVTNDSLAYSRFYNQSFRKAMIQKGWKGIIEGIHYIDGDIQSKNLKKKILEIRPQLIYAPVYARDIVEVYAAAIVSDDELSVLTHAGLYSSKNELAKIYNPKVKLIFNGLWDQKSKSSKSATYDRIVKNNCKGQEFLPRAMAVFDAMDLVTTVRGKVPDLGGLAFVEYLLKTHYDGFLGPTRFNGKQEPYRSLNLYELDRRKMKYLTSVSSEGA